MPTTAAPNAAAALLRRCGSQREIARALGLSHPAIGAWLRGRATPSLNQRERVRETFGINPELWERRAEPAAHAVPTAELVDAADAALPVDEDGLRSLVAQLQAARSGETLTAAVLSKLALAETRARESLAKCRSWDEASILASAAFQRVEAALTRALEPWPDAMRAVADALGALAERTPTDET